MIGKIQISIIVTLFGLMLLSCQPPETPQQVTQHFWQAVIEEKPDRVVHYSTLSNLSDYDGFSMEWRGFQPSWGKITIDNNHASVESTFTAPTGSELKQRKLITYLAKHNDEWKVDYQKTRDAFKVDKAGGLFGKLNQLGKQLSEQFEHSTDDLNAELEILGEKLQELSDQVGSEAAEGVEKFADELEQSLEKLEESIDRALKGDRNKKPKQGNGQLQEI